MIYQISKRLLDIVCSALAITITSPIWLITAIGIWLSDPGPVFYVANRIGKNNQPFKMYKFRSMRCGKVNESVFRGEEDRIFPFGKFIRSTKIDELPQLINIFIGTMSIVGPRPAAADQFEFVRDGKEDIISTVKVGLTSPAAIYDYIYGDTVDGETEYREKVLPTRLKLDRYYVRHMSMFYDLKIIWYTVVCVVSCFFHIIPKKILDELVTKANMDVNIKNEVPAA